MTDWMGSVAPGERPQLEDEATRRARHEVLATLLGAYADGELPPATMTQVEAHLLGCDRCRRELRVQQAIGDQLSTLREASATAGQLARLRAITATMPPPTKLASAHRIRRSIALGGLLLLAAGGAWWARGGAARALAGPPVVRLAAAPRVLTAVVADYRLTSARDLPGRARDLETVRQAVPFPVRPLLREALRLVGAWTVELDGELAAVLAYRWHDRLVVQYVLSDAALFRVAELRRAFHQGAAVVWQDGEVGMLGWASADGGSLLVADVRWRTLRDLQPAAP